MVRKAYSRKRATKLKFFRVLFMACLVCLVLNCGHKTAVEQMTEQTNNPVLLGQAAYYDLMGIFEITAESFLANKPYLLPGQIERCQDLLTKMYEVLQDAKKLNGLAKLTQLENFQDEFMANRRAILYEFADLLDNK